MIIKSIQRGTISIGTGTTSATASITSVDTTKSELTLLGGSRQTATDITVVLFPRIILTNATTITAAVNEAPGSGALILSWELLEYT